MENSVEYTHKIEEAIISNAHKIASEIVASEYMLMFHPDYDEITCKIKAYDEILNIVSE